MSRLTFCLACALGVALHTSASAQGTGQSRRGGVGPHAVAVIPVRAVAAQTPPADVYEEEDDVVAVDTTPDINLDLRVVSMRDPISQTTSDGAIHQVMVITVANFGHAASSSARLSLNGDTRGHPVGRTQLPVPPLAPGAKVSMTVPFTVPPDLQGQVCFTASLALPATAEQVSNGAK